MRMFVFEASYENLLSKGKKSKINFRRLRTCVKIYKTLNDLNSSFMNNIFRLKVNGREICDKYKLNLDIPKTNRQSKIFWLQKPQGIRS